MLRPFIFIVTLLCVSFIHQPQKSPRLTKLTVVEDKDNCTAPNAVFEQKYLDKTLNLSFGYDDYFEKQDTIAFSLKKDSLFLKIIKRYKREIVFKDGKADTLPGRRSDPDCECYTLFKLEIKDLPNLPKHIIVNNYIHDTNLGFVNLNYLSQHTEKIQKIEESRKYVLDSLFILPTNLRSFADISELAWYLKRRGSLQIQVLDADSESEKKLVSQLQKLLIKYEMICPTRTSIALNNKVVDNDSTSIAVKILDSKSFLFPEYIRQKNRN
jgi:hypothetical protein